MLPEWGQVGFLLLLAIVFPIGGIGTSWLFGVLGIRPDRPDAVKEDTYECGVETEGPAWVQFNFRYYYFALLFVIFDVEAVFLVPFAVAFTGLPVGAFVAMLVFLLLLVEGVAWAWMKGVLTWK